MSPVGTKVKLNEQLVEKTRQVVSGVEEVEFASIFGSLVGRGETYHDVDVALKVKSEGKYEAACAVIAKLAEALSIPEEHIDIVDLDRAELELKKEVLVQGIVLVDKINYRKKLVDEINLKYPEYGEIKERTIREWLRSQDPSSIDLHTVKRRLDFVRSELGFLNEHVLDHDLDEIGESPVLKRLLERSFQLIVEAILDICRHIVSVMGWGPALGYSDLVEQCSRHGVIDEELKGKLLDTVRTRNVIFHRYSEVDYGALYREAKELDSTAGSFERRVIDFTREREEIRT